MDKLTLNEDGSRMTKEQWEGYKAWCDGKGPKEFKIIDEEGRQIIYN